ncbi:MAG: CBS domain-containing protein [Clostridia bacterium]|jgi:predicted transcriptional regulator|nr:CBS domain-containing protein [Clostridia bacterium]MDD4408790.1 CBS domain-containing protein [Clostridia bacterium]
MTTNEEKSNATRFINAYNLIDHELRVQHDFRRSMSFSEMIRKAVSLNFIVRKYEDKLIDYGRLRNAIIHKSNDEFIIADPHNSVVEEMEKIADLISAPPKVWDKVCKKDVVTVQYDVPLKRVIELIYTTSFSNLPVYKNNGLIGVANGQKILDVLGEQITKGVDINEFLNQTKIEDIIKSFKGKFFEVKPRDITIEQALDVFYQNRKILLIVLTESGSMNEIPLGVLTTGDIMDMNSILENF